MDTISNSFANQLQETRQLERDLERAGISPYAWTIEDLGIPAERIKHKNIVVFISPIDSMEEIGRAVETGNWSKGEVFQPKS